MNCDHYSEWISAALDGELTAEERQELDRHLAVCPSCKELFDTLSGQSAALRALEPRLPEGLHDRILKDLPPQPAPARQGKVIHWKRWGSLAACLVLAVALGGYFRFGSGMTANETAAMSESTQTADGALFERANPSTKSDEDLTSEDFSAEAPASSSGTLPEAEPGSAPEALSDENCLSVPDLTPGVTQEDQSISQLGFSNDRYLRVGYGFTPHAPSAMVISSAASLADYLEGFGTNRFDGNGNPIPIEALESMKAAYPEEFFSDHCLLVILLEEGSGSTRHELLSVDGQTATIRRIVPEMGTADMAAWLIVAELDTMLDDGTVFSIQFAR